MFAHQKRIYSALQIALDIACLKLIWMGTIRARIILNPLVHEHLTVDKSALWAPSMMLILPFWLVLSVRFRLYRTPEKSSWWAIQMLALENTAVLATVTAVVTLFSRQFGEFVSRLFVPVMLPVAFSVLCFSRLLLAAAIPSIQKHSDKRHRFALIGDWETARRFIEHLPEGQTRLFSGLIVPEGCGVPPANDSLPVLGTTSQVGEVINKERLTRIILLNASLPSDELERCSQVFERMDVQVSCALEISPDPIQLNVSRNYGLPFIEILPVRFTRRQERIKRVFDVILAAIALLILSPVFAVIAVLIKSTSNGPILHNSFRIGKGGRRFIFFKFRSMYQSSERQLVASANEKTGHIFKMKYDPRITPVGRVLRRYSLDELPQLVNILLGEMSFVGPRPLPASDLGLDGMSKEYGAWSEGRSSVQPGLTGLWQVSGRSDLHFEDMVRLDLAYIQNWSLALDLRILLDTPMLVLRGSGAY